jgi:tetratricopeptide (TPR) repeat protein
VAEFSLFLKGVSRLGLAGLSCCLLLGGQVLSPGPSRTAAVNGVVRDAAGKPLPGVLVILEASGDTSPIQTRSESDGKFAFLDLPSGVYTVRAQKRLFQETTLRDIAVGAGDQKHLDMVLVSLRARADASSEMQLDDSAKFSIAGIKDWTAAGGHGSEANLRASEDLARDTHTFSQPSEPTRITTKQSEADLRAAYTRSPKSFAANHELGAFYLYSHREREAIPLLQAASEIKPEDYANMYDLALAYERAGDLSQARDFLHKMLTKFTNADAHRLLGDVEERLGDPLSAVREYERAAELDSSEANFFAWGVELLIHRAVQPAVEVFTKGSNAYPDSERMLAGLGASLYAAGMYDEAAAKLCAASDLKLSDSAPYLFLARMEQASSQPLPCVEQKMRRFVNNQPDNAQANYYLAVALLKRADRSRTDARSQEAGSLLHKTISLDPKFAEAYVEQGALQVAHGDLAGAETQYAKAIESNPNLPDAHFRLGQLYRRTGADSKAREEFQKYEQLQKAQSAQVEQQRRELQQFVIVLKDSPVPAQP